MKHLKTFLNEQKSSDYDRALEYQEKLMKEFDDDDIIRYLYDYHFNEKERKQADRMMNSSTPGDIIMDITGKWGEEKLLKVFKDSAEKMKKFE